MKTIKILLGLCLIVLSYFAQAQNGLESIFVERYYVADAIDEANSTPTILVGSVTYRIYADMLPGYKVQTIFGIPAHPLTMTTTTYFFNQEDYGSSIPTFSSTNAKKNTVMLDSWLSTGGACNGWNGVPKTEDNGVNNFVNSNVPQLLQNNAAQAGIPLTTQDGMLQGSVSTTGTLGIDQAMLDIFGDGSANGNTFLINDGSWYCLTGAAGPIPASNKVLIAQITTDGTFHFELNIQIGTPSGGTENYVYSNPTGVELTIPSLIQTFLPVPTAPSVNITAPSNNSTFTVGTPIDITASATDIDGTITQVEFFVDGTSIGVDVSVPYSATYTGLTATAHTITAKATDNEGLFTVSAPINFNLTNAAPTIFAVTGGGSYCIGTAGLPVGLAGSQTGITYTLFKNTIAQTPTVSGTGSAITFGNQLAGTYTVSGTDGTVTIPMSGNAVNTEVQLPVPTITGSADICDLSAANVYTTQVGMTNYLWSVSSGGTITSGAGTNEINVAWNTIGNEHVSVNYTNSAGCSAIEPTFFNVNVSTQPTPAGSITGIPNVCEGSQGIVYSVPAITNASTYNWSVPAGATITSGATTNSITVDFAFGATSGNIFANGVNACGSGTNSPAYNVTVNPIPATPVVSLHGDTLESSANSGNQWYFEGVAIPGATGQRHVALNKGNYSVVVTLDNCSSSVSNTILVLEVSIKENELANTAGIYPNPNNGIFYINVKYGNENDFKVEIYTIQGSHVFNKVINDFDGSKQIDMSGVPSGIYTVVLTSHENSIKRKVFVVK
ncbi:MAG: Ig-like domain-containing protein [Bacteroidales bacterium]